MKKQLLLISLLSLSLGSFAACSDDEIREGAIASTGTNRFYITVEDVIENVDATATDSRLSIDNLKVSFEDGDKIGVTSGDIVNLEYNLKVNSDGTVIASAVDESQSVYMNAGDSVYAYYPYKEDATEVAKFSFPAEQVQSDEGASQLADYDVLVATPGVLSSNNNALSFGHAVTWVEFDVYNDYSTSVDYLQSVTLTAPESVFVTEAELNTCADANSSDYKSFKPTATTNELKISVEEGVEDWNAMEVDGMTTLRMAIVPVDLSDMEITVAIETKEKNGNDKITYTGDGMDFSAGREYRLILGETEEEIEPEPVGDLEFYIPIEWRSNNFESDNSTWSYNRCMESTHFIIFWEKSFGSDPTNAPRSNGVDMSFNPSTVLEYAEEIYDVNVNTLGFKDMQGSSYLNQYKMIIVVYYDIGQDFLATGSGYDDVIGALWANVDGCTEETMAHEIGHCFQYQTWCDAQLTGSNNSSSCGWRYGFGKNPGSGDDDGNAWWEMCAQWQCFQVYPSGMFSSYYGDFPPYVHLHPLHETPRYSNYFVQDYWIMLNGNDFLGTVWRMAEMPEDPFDVYMRLTGASQSDFNEMMFDYACRLQTYDITHCANNGGTSNIDAFSKYPGILDNGDGYYRINKATAPENFGFNAIRIKAPGSATTMTAELVGMAGESGYRSPSDTTGTLWSLEAAGWKFGFVGYNSRTNTRYYGDHYSVTGKSGTGTATFNCPADCDYVWLVVMGAPQSYWHHAWNNTSTDDEQWPYKFKLTNAELYNSVQQETWNSSSKTYTISLSFERSTGESDYVAATLAPDLGEIASGLGLYSSSQFASNLSSMTVVGLNADGTTTSGTTANGTYGYWFDGSGKVCSYGDNSYVYVETDDFSSITFGQFPDHCVSGKTYHAGYQITYGGNTVKIIVQGTAE